jgi:DNA-binding PadR family transcriptional regulator
MTRADNIAGNELTVLRALAHHSEPVHARRLWLTMSPVIAESSVYVVLRRLVDAGAVLVRDGRGIYKGPRRPLYVLSARGRKRLNRD